MSEMLAQLGLALMYVVAAWLLSWLANRVLSRVVRRLIGLTETRLDDVIVRAANFPLRATIMIAGIELALRQLDFVPASWTSLIERYLFLIYAFIAFTFLYQLINGLIYWYGREVVTKTGTDLDDKFLDLFRRLALLLLILIVIVMVLGRFGVEISALVTTLGIGSLAIALAAQETLGDMFAGFTILVDRPFKVDDRVEILDIDTWGDVKEIGLRSTRILTRDNRMVTVPNSVIGKGLVVNYSDPSTVYRVETHVGVAYGTDLERVREVMIAAIRAEDWVMMDRPIEALFLEFGDSALIFRVRCWIEHYVETRRIIDKMNTTLYNALNAARVEIPFPQRDIHLISEVGHEKPDGFAA